MRRILSEELERWPECAPLTADGVGDEPARGRLRAPGAGAADGFALSGGLVLHAPEPDRAWSQAGEAIAVVPYGVDLARFRPDPNRSDRGKADSRKNQRHTEPP